MSFTVAVLIQVHCTNGCKKPGFRHEPCQKGYYVDGHEKLTTIKYIKQLLIIYLSYEPRAHRWVQISLLEALELEEKKLIPKNSGFRDDKGGSIKAEVRKHLSRLDMMSAYSSNFTQQTNHGKLQMERQS
jgi:hypothetical protein